MKLLNKTFFKFVFGFGAILLIGILGILATGYYDETKNNLSSVNNDKVEVEN